MLTICCPSSRIPEREYIVDVIFNEFLGIPYVLLFEEREDVEISYPACGDSKLRFADVLLSTAEENWLTPASLPQGTQRTLIVDRLRADGEKGIPVIYGASQATEFPIQHEGDIVSCGLDLFGSCFFMLTRYEEVVTKERDQHDRFSSGQSYAVEVDMLHYPIVNVYTELLWLLISDIWPALSGERKSREMRSIISHDVDHPFFAHRRSKFSLAKESVGDLLKRREFESGLRKARMIGPGGQDPYNTFDWLMELSERAGLKSSFFFITEHTEPGIDGNYGMDDQEIRNLLLRIHKRGHEAGLHPSYQTYLSAERIKKQFELLKQAAEAAGIRQEHYGGRQHFLRWRAPDTWQHWEDAGLQYDSTLGYADRPGFRCGVCYEYPVFNLLTRQRLQLRERPLVVMEQSLIHAQYGGLGTEEAFQVISGLYQQCKKYNGDFTLLWHNSNLVRSRDRELYRRCIEQLKL